MAAFPLYLQSQNKFNIMKKLLIVLFSLASTAGIAQIRNGNAIIQPTQIGVYGGLSVANQITSDPTNYYSSYADNSKAGVIGGISVSVPISYGWFIQPELNYTGMGTNYYDGDFDGNINLNMNYLNLPVLFRYSQPFTGFGVLFGPQYSYLLDANTIPSGSIKGDYEKGDVTSDYKRSDLSGVVGLEYYFPNDGRGGPKFGLSARYQFGFLNVNNGGVTYPDGYNAHVNNNAFFITAGVRF